MGRVDGEETSDRRLSVMANGMALVIFVCFRQVEIPPGKFSVRSLFNPIILQSDQPDSRTILIRVVKTTLFVSLRTRTLVDSHSTIV